jgi:hypothetical protein
VHAADGRLGGSGLRLLRRRWGGRRRCGGWGRLLVLHAAVLAIEKLTGRALDRRGLALRFLLVTTATGSGEQGRCSN